MEKMMSMNGNLAIRQDERRIVKIEAREKPETVLLRLAAYTRVSTNSEDQLNSLGAQTRYYTTMIGAHDGWKLVDIYADEGITGTSADKRDEFQRLMTDCRNGLIDRVLTKSISRFARNTQDCLEAIRELKSIGVSVYFERENLDTSTMSSEMITAVMASLAQRESESISSNLRWSYQKRMERGEFNTNKAPFGFRLSDDGLVVEESEAEIIRLIYSRYLSGHSRKEIAEELRAINAPTRADVPKWQTSTVYCALTNERYAGDALLGKRIASDSFPHRMIYNHGERPKYYVENSNPAIIPKEDFNKVVELRERRRLTSDNSPKNHPLQKKIMCSCCGAVFKRQQPRKTEYWICYSRYKSIENCSMPSVTTAAIEEAFCRLYYKLKYQGEKILSNIISLHSELKSRRMLWKPEVIELNKKISDLTSQNQLLSELKKQGLVDSDIFISQTNTIAEQLQQAKMEKSRILDAETNDTVRQTMEMIEVLANGPDYIETFDTDLFNTLVDNIIVKDGEHIVFHMKNGLQLTEEIEKRKR